LGVILTYDGSLSAPTNVGSYTVIGTVNDANYVGSATNTLVISPSLVSTNLVFQVVGGQLQLSWPVDHRGWTLETNAVGLAATNAWFPYPGSASLTNLDVPMVTNRTNVFFRLTYQP
jgi:MBG domain